MNKFEWYYCKLDLKNPEEGSVYLVLNKDRDAKSYGGWISGSREVRRHVVVIKESLLKGLCVGNDKAHLVCDYMYAFNDDEALESLKVALDSYAFVGKMNEPTSIAERAAMLLK